MKRREFTKAAGAAAAVAVSTAGCGGGGGGGAAGTVAAGPAGGTPASATGVLASPTASSASQVNLSGLAMGTNLSGMEWAKPGLRYGMSTMPNLNFTVPRTSDIAYLAANGFNKNRLPIQWELLQPVLHDIPAAASVQALLGAPGALHAGYAAYITGVLDAHAAAGTRCIVDLHNYGRYQDFRYQADGSVPGLRAASDALIRPYTTDGSQVLERIISLAPGASLKVSHFTDFWTRVARQWKDHPGFGGYGLMNEPHDLPDAGGTEASYGAQDATIWPTFAQAAITAIRSIDATNPIYVAGNDWEAAMTIGTNNPGWPLAGTNLIYEVHMYLDASCSGYAFDYDTEAAKGYSAGLSGPINLDTGVNRLRMAVDWANAHGVKLALTEVGMPVDDARWQEMFQRAVNLARQNNVEVYSWMGGNHWPAHNYAINHVPGWHQNRTLEPAVAGPMKAAAGVALAALFDDGPGFAAAGASVTITVYARGNLSAPVTLNVASSNGGTFSKTLLTIPAGANGQDSFTFAPAPNTVTTLTYSSDGQLGGQIPPPRKVYSLADPVAYASTNLQDAAMAILAKFGASKWDMADGHTDYMLGAPASDGQPLRAVSDSGYGSSPGNAMEMINWVNKEMGDGGSVTFPVARTVNGRKTSDHSAANTFGLWCKKAEPIPGVQANPKSRVPYDLQDTHFAIATLSVPGSNSGVIFQASKAQESYTSELTLSGGRPQARWVDANGQAVELTSSSVMAANTPAVVSMTCVPGAQTLRVNASVAATAGATMSASVFNQMLIGWGFLGYYPRDGFGGNVFAVIAGKGAPSEQEMAVLERYLAGGAGLSI